MKKKFSAEKPALMALFIALAMVLSFIESQLPPLVAIPGIKIGLANIAVIFVLYRFGWLEAIIVSLIRVFLISLLFGNFISMLYGLCGAALCLAVMSLLKGLTHLSPVTVSAIGGVCHNLGQIAVACFIIDSAKLLYYLPILLISGTLSGLVIGIVGGMLLKRII